MIAQYLDGIPSGLSLWLRVEDLVVWRMYLGPAMLRPSNIGMLCTVDMINMFGSQVLKVYPLVNVDKAMERSTIFLGKVTIFYGNITGMFIVSSTIFHSHVRL